MSTLRQRQVPSFLLSNPSFIIGQRERQTEKQTTSKAITLPAEKREERGEAEAEMGEQNKQQEGVAEHQGCTLSKLDLIAC